MRVLTGPHGRVQPRTVAAHVVLFERDVAAGGLMQPPQLPPAPAAPRPAPTTGGCEPTAAHPTRSCWSTAPPRTRPSNWAPLSPKLARAGYSVFAFDYGLTLVSGGLIGGLGDIPASAETMAALVDKVPAATGAAEVDVVGHSQGGMMPH